MLTVARGRAGGTGRTTVDSVEEGVFVEIVRPLAVGALSGAGRRRRERCSIGSLDIDRMRSISSDDHERRMLRATEDDAQHMACLQHPYPPSRSASRPSLHTRLRSDQRDLSVSGEAT